MPLIHVHLAEGKSDDYIQKLCDGIHETLMQTWNIPEKDRFHIISEHKPKRFQIDKEMWDIERSDDVVVIHITTSPRTTDMKLAFYKALPTCLNEKIGLRTEDIFISILSNSREDWSFGNGQAQLLN